MWGDMAVLRRQGRITQSPPGAARAETPGAPLQTSKIFGSRERASQHNSHVPRLGTHSPQRSALKDRGGFKTMERGNAEAPTAHHGGRRRYCAVTLIRAEDN